MRSGNWIIPIVLVGAALFYLIICASMGPTLLNSPSGLVLSAIWWVAVVVACVGIRASGLRQ